MCVLISYQRDNIGL